MVKAENQAFAIVERMFVWFIVMWFVVSSFIFLYHCCECAGCTDFACAIRAHEQQEKGA